MSLTWLVLWVSGHKTKHRADCSETVPARNQTFSSFISWPSVFEHELFTFVLIFTLRDKFNAISKFLWSPAVLPQQLWIMDEKALVHLGKPLWNKFLMVPLVNMFSSELHREECIVFEQPGLQCLQGVFLSLLYHTFVISDSTLSNSQPVDAVHG